MVILSSSQCRKKIKSPTILLINRFAIYFSTIVLLDILTLPNFRHTLPLPRACPYSLFKFFIPLDNDIEAVIEFLELFKHVLSVA